jgi:hypothetical protein
MEIHASATFESLTVRIAQEDENGSRSIVERVRRSMVLQATVLLDPDRGQSKPPLSQPPPTGGPAAAQSFYPGLNPSQTPDSVAGRVLDFIRALAGGDLERLEVMMEAAEQAFAEAEKIFGGTLPDISYTTMKLVRAGLTDMLAEFRGEPQSEESPAAASLELVYVAQQTSFSQYTAQGVIA